MVDIQSLAAEIRQGHKKEEERKKQDENIMVCHSALLHRATIMTRSVCQMPASDELSVQLQLTNVSIHFSLNHSESSVKRQQRHSGCACVYAL